MSLATPDVDGAHRGASSGLLSKTCQNCFQLKIRCDRTQRQDMCDRCSRLGKHCIFRPARRRDNSVKRDSRIQALEAQVQELLHTRPSHPTQPSIPEHVPTPGSVPSSTRSPEPGGDIIDEEIVTSDKAETLIQVYRSDMMPHFPFVIIPPHTTSMQLRQEQPFLFLAVLSVACFHDLSMQEKLADRFKSMLSDKVLFGGDDCLQLEYLQGLLIVLAWNQFHAQSTYYSQYLSLAVSLAVDMRLDRKYIRNNPSANSKRNPVAMKTARHLTWGSAEQRAAAGMFYISSTISKLLDKMNTFQCTSFIEEGCMTLREKGEYRTDRDLYHVIRLQRIIENIDTLVTQPTTDTEAQTAYLRVRSELEEFRAYLVSDVSDSHLLFMQFHTAKLFLYQVAFFERNLQKCHALDVSILCEGLESAKSFLDLYLWLPPKSEMALTNSEWIQLSFGVTLAAKFAIVSRAPAVEVQTRELRQRLNIENIFRHLSLRIGALVGRARDGDKKKDIFAFYEQRVRRVQSWFEGMVRATGSDSPLSPSARLQQQMTTQRDGIPQQHTPPQQHQQQNIPSNLLSTVHTTMASTQSYTPQKPIHYSNGPVPNPPMTGMDPLSVNAFPSISYDHVPTLAFPDLMTAPGWDMPFTIPMEDQQWLFDMPNGYQGVSPPSDGESWGSSVGMQ